MKAGLGATINSREEKMAFLEALGIEKENHGVSTGLNWPGMGDGPKIEVVYRQGIHRHGGRI
jgi:hypothetical protein